MHTGSEVSAHLSNAAQACWQKAVICFKYFTWIVNMQCVNKHLGADVRNCVKCVTANACNLLFVIALEAAKIRLGCRCSVFYTFDLCCSCRAS